MFSPPLRHKSSSSSLTWSLVVVLFIHRSWLVRHWTKYNENNDATFAMTERKWGKNYCRSFRPNHRALSHIIILNCFRVYIFFSFFSCILRCFSLRLFINWVDGGNTWILLLLRFYFSLFAFPSLILIKL